MLGALRAPSPTARRGGFARPEPRRPRPCRADAAAPAPRPGPCSLARGAGQALSLAAFASSLLATPAPPPAAAALLAPPRPELASPSRPAAAGAGVVLHTPVAPPPALQPDEAATVALFRRATPSVVFITTLAARRDAFTLDPVEVTAAACDCLSGTQKLLPATPHPRPRRRPRGLGLDSSGPTARATSWRVGAAGAPARGT